MKFSDSVPIAANASRSSRRDPIVFAQDSLFDRDPVHAPPPVQPSAVPRPIPDKRFPARRRAARRQISISSAMRAPDSFAITSKQNRRDSASTPANSPIAHTDLGGTLAGIAVQFLVNRFENRTGDAHFVHFDLQQILGS